MYYYEYQYQCKNNNYYITLNTNKYTDILIDDEDIADFLGMELNKYQDMLKQFNGNMIEQNRYPIGVFFNEEEDCQKAINYLCEITNGCLIAKELIGE